MSEQHEGDHGYDDGGEYSPRNLERAARAAQAAWLELPAVVRAHGPGGNLAAWAHVAQAVLQSYRAWGPQVDARFALSELRMRLGLLEQRYAGPLRPRFSPADALELLERCVAMAQRPEGAADEAAAATPFLAAVQADQEQDRVAPLTQDRQALMREILLLAGELWPDLSPFELTESAPLLIAGVTPIRPGLEQEYSALLTAQGQTQFAIRGNARALEAMRSVLAASLGRL